MASDRPPLLRPSPADGDDGVGRVSKAPSSPANATISSSGGGDTIHVTNSSSSGTQEQQNADDAELTDDDQARDRDDIQHSPSSSAASRTRCAPRKAASCPRSKAFAFVVVAGACLLVAAGASFEAGVRSGRARPGPGCPSEEVEREGDTAAPASPGDGLPLPQCYSTGTADPSIGAWRRCDGGAGECSPIGNATVGAFCSRYPRVGAEKIRGFLFYATIGQAHPALAQFFCGWQASSILYGCVCMLNRTRPRSRVAGTDTGA